MGDSNVYLFIYLFIIVFDQWQWNMSYNVA